ncbi:MAG: hypothetical protein LBR08_10410 [Bacteroidales bacterium]|jgi:hypothetical protein|nr:hypothetical protein [Bacteroidales bacterium]
MKKILDLAQATVFGALGITALVAAAMGYLHHIGSAAACAVMVWVSVHELRKENDG